MKKDKMVSVRINSKINDLIKAKGLSVQKILDNYIRKTFKVTEIIRPVVRNKKRG